MTGWETPRRETPSSTFRSVRALLWELMNRQSVAFGDFLAHLEEASSVHGRQDTPMGLLDSEAGKLRLLTIEIPAIERYNETRDREFRIRLVRQGSNLILCYRLMPTHNIYELETRLYSSYPVVPPETRVLTPLRHCPHLLEGQTLCLWRQGSSRQNNRWDPSRHTCIFAVQAAWRWLACYEIWYETGEWPLPEAR
ncbi:MAG: hypothetical protein RMI91_08510 [Gemmatales bacterium]|nr:hypothetical protein [Gemmatales bacterium]MDW7994682.1 hypothetical protein [Gemmatales bacterium]